MKKTLISFTTAFFLIAASGAVFAASFIATVDRTSIPADESVTLDLSVEGTDPKGAPDVSALDRDFSILSRGQSLQTNIINGKGTSTTGWEIVLMPKRAGEIVIPSLSVDSDSGTLQTEPVTIEVGKASPTAQSGDLTVDAQVSKHDPYKNEPVMLTVKLIARKQVADVGLPDVKIDNAVVEPQGKPEVRETNIGGTRATVVEMRYIVTPLQPGALEIPGFAFHGKVASGERETSPFDFDIPDPFNMMREFNNIAGFAAMRPFAVQSKPVTLDVRKPAAAMDPWLPLIALKLADEWDDSQKPRVGEPLTRKLTLSAIGMTGAVLPDLERRIDPEGNFRIYADKADIGQSLHADGKISGWRQQSFTLIPQKEGKLTLPGIRVAWWDVENNRMAYATIPAKTIDVAPGQPGMQPAPQAPPRSTANAPPARTPQPASGAAPAAEVPHSLYILIAGLCGVIAVLAGFVILLSHKLAQQNRPRKAPAPVSANEDKISLDALKRAKTADDIRLFMQTYAHQRWGLPANAALKTIAREIERYVHGDAQNYLLSVDAALYAGEHVDAARIAGLLYDLLKSPSMEVLPSARPRFGSLNPS